MAIIRVFSRNIFNRIRNVKREEIRNIKERIAMNRMEGIARIPSTVSNIKIACHNDDIVNVDFSIL